MSIDNLSGLYSAKKIFAQLHRENFSPHAYLFYGSKGSGKSTLALEFSKFFLDEKKLTPDNQIDLLWIQPSETSSWIRLSKINGSSKDNEHPSLQEFLMTLPLTHPFKVVVIEDAHRLTLEAAHALLKTLEEPPKFVKIILTTTKRHEVLPTIISRCINICCELPSLEEQNNKWPANTLVEKIFSKDAPAKRQHTKDHLDLYQTLLDIFEETSHPFKLKTAEKLQNWCDQYAKRFQIPLRQAFLEGLECLASWFLYSKRYQNVQKVCRIHKMNQYNFNLNYLIDALVVEIF